MAVDDIGHDNEEEMTIQDSSSAKQSMATEVRLESWLTEPS